jgi:hypothetical protein
MRFTRTATNHALTNVGKRLRALSFLYAVTLLVFMRFTRTMKRHALSSSASVLFRSHAEYAVSWLARLRFQSTTHNHSLKADPSCRAYRTASLTANIRRTLARYNHSQNVVCKRLPFINSRYPLTLLP